MRVFVFQLLFLFFLNISTGFAQNNSPIELTGIIYDENTKLPLPGATVFIEKLSNGAIADVNGKYVIAVPPGRYKIAFSYLSYQSNLLEIEIKENQVLQVGLKPETATIQEVVVTSKGADHNLKSTETGLITIQKKELEKLPYLMGEVDPIRIIQLMPGVQTSGEGNTGFYVRGGAVDQNLILLDNAVVYNPSHLFGFFSVFNGNVINQIDLYKGGIPASMGGRLSSITKIHTRRGNMKSFKTEGGIGLIATNLSIEGPIIKDKLSILLSARRTYFDLFSESLKRSKLLNQDLNYYFYDLNLNLDYNIGSNDQISFRTYNGKDDFDYVSENGFSNSIRWGNRTHSLTWKHFFHNDLHSELSLLNSHYDMDFGAKITSYSFNIVSNIEDKGLSYKVNWRKGKNHITTGLTYTYHVLKPNNINAASQDVQLDFQNKTILQADEFALFINDRLELSEKWEISVGLRLSSYSQLGSFKRFLQNESFQIIDTISYSRNKRIKTYVNIEPRAAVRYSIGESSSIKFSYDRNFQYLHMAPLSSVSLPMDIWVPSSSVIKPQYSDQLSIGYFRNLKEKIMEGSVVFYYKEMSNQTEYRDGVILGYSKGFNFDDNFVFGTGRSFGTELSIKKTSGKINGMINYTLSKTTRKFDGLNAGRAFAAKYDRLHDFSTLINYDYNKHWTISTIFVYGTGNALNLPVARYLIQGNVINEYGARNSFRMPAYHRMDLSITYTTRKSSKFESFWNFSIYNIYNRKNPYYIYFETQGNVKEFELKTSIKQVSLFPIIPSLTYRFKF